MNHMVLTKLPIERLPGVSKLQEMAAKYYEQRLFEHVRRGVNIPKHVAVILDGNRRFARESDLEETRGHAFGAEKLEEVLDWCQELGIEHFTVYAFSTENFERSGDEVQMLMDLFARKFKDAAADDRIHKYKVRVRALGDVRKFPARVRNAIREAERATQSYNGHTLNIAVGYGGRAELANAVRKICERIERGEIEPGDVDERLIGDNLYTADLPDPDLVIRTSGEERLSGFLLWQSAYSELYFCEANWPSFSKRDFLRAISTYQGRVRRYGT